MKNTFVETGIALMWFIVAGLFAWLIVDFNKTYGNGWQTAVVILITIISIPMLILFSGFIRAFSLSKQKKGLQKTTNDFQENFTKYLRWGPEQQVPPYFIPSVNYHEISDMTIVYIDTKEEIKWKIKDSKKESPPPLVGWRLRYGGLSSTIDLGREGISATAC